MFSHYNHATRSRIEYVLLEYQNSTKSEYYLNQIRKHNVPIFNFSHDPQRYHQCYQS